MKAKNRVVNGEHTGCEVTNVNNQMLVISKGTRNIPLSKRMVANIVEINTESNKSVSNTIGRSIVGGALLGGVGAIAGAVTSKNNVSHTIMIQFKDGKKSLIEIDDKLYGILNMSLF